MLRKSKMLPKMGNGGGIDSTAVSIFVVVLRRQRCLYGRAISQKECAWEHSSLNRSFLKIQQGPVRAYYCRLSICQFNQYNNKY